MPLLLASEAAGDPWDAAPTYGQPTLPGEQLDFGLDRLSLGVGQLAHELLPEERQPLRDPPLPVDDPAPHETKGRSEAGRLPPGCRFRPESPTGCGTNLSDNGVVIGERPLTVREREVLDVFLAAGFPGADAIRRGVNELRVTGRPEGRTGNEPPRTCWTKGTHCSREIGYRPSYPVRRQAAPSARRSLPVRPPKTTTSVPVQTIRWLTRAEVMLGGVDDCPCHVMVCGS